MEKRKLLKEIKQNKNLNYYLPWVEAILKFNSSSLKRKFSVGIKPAKKILIPSRTEKGMVTTPYADGVPYKQQI